MGRRNGGEQDNSSNLPVQRHWADMGEESEGESNVRNVSHGITVPEQKLRKSNEQRSSGKNMRSERRQSGDRDDRKSRGPWNQNSGRVSYGRRNSNPSSSHQIPAAVENAKRKDDLLQYVAEEPKCETFRPPGYDKLVDNSMPAAPKCAVSKSQPAKTVFQPCQGAENMYYHVHPAHEYAPTKDVSLPMMGCDCRPILEQDERGQFMPNPRSQEFRPIPSTIAANTMPLEPTYVQRCQPTYAHIGQPIGLQPGMHDFQNTMDPRVMVGQQHRMQEPCMAQNQHSYGCVPLVLNDIPPNNQKINLMQMPPSNQAFAQGVAMNSSAAHGSQHVDKVQFVRELDLRNLMHWKTLVKMHQKAMGAAHEQSKKLRAHTDMGNSFSNADTRHRSSSASRGISHKSMPTETYAGVAKHRN